MQSTWMTLQIAKCARGKDLRRFANRGVVRDCRRIWGLESGGSADIDRPECHCTAANEDSIADDLKELQLQEHSHSPHFGQDQRATHHIRVVW